MAPSQAAQAATIDSSSPEAFIRSITPWAQQISQQTGIPAAAMIGMAANETGYGKFAAGNNLFGIKGTNGPAGSINSQTWEDYGSGPVTINANFKAYANPGQSFQDFADLVTNAPRYAAAKGQTTVEGFVQALKDGGYMTDPAYVGKISNIVQRFGGVINDALSGAGQAVQGAGQAVQGAAQQAANYVFPVQGYSGDVALHWGDVPGGSDLFAPRGTPVLAMRGGKVVEAGYNSIGGNSVLIQGDDGNQYYYAHFNEAPSVKVGQTVGTGTYLGPVGNTGDAAHTGTHLHIGIGPSILLGADKFGGTGGNFDAVGLLRRVLTGQGAQQATGPAAGPGAMAVPAGPGAPTGQPAQPAQPQAQTMAQFIQQHQAAGQGMPTDTELGNFVLSQPPEQTAASVGQPQPIQQPTSPFDVVGNIASGLGGAVSGAVSGVGNALGGLFGRGGPGSQPPTETAPAATASPFPGLPQLPTGMPPEGGGYGVGGPLLPGEAASALAPITTPAAQFGTAWQAAAQANAAGNDPILQPIRQGISQGIYQLNRTLGGTDAQLDQAQAAMPTLPSSGAEINPYRDIVQQGVPTIVEGAQQGDIGKVLSGVLQIVGGVGSALPGVGGETAAAEAAARATPSVAAAVGGREAGQAATVAGTGQEALGAAGRVPDLGPADSELLDRFAQAGPEPIPAEQASQSIASSIQPNTPSGAMPAQAVAQFATAVGGGTAGGLAGWESDPNAPIEQRLARTAAGALAGAGLSYAAGRVLTSGVDPWQIIRAERVGSLAGGLPTITHIAFNAPLQAAWKVLGDAPLSITRPETIPLEFMGAWNGLIDWARSAPGTLATPGPIAQQIGGAAGQAIETGLLGLVRAHPVIQDAARQIGSNMELWRQAGVEASNAGLTRFTAPWWNEVQRLAANPTAQMATDAQRVGDTFALRGPMGQTGTALGQFLQNSRLGQFLNPFFNIGYQVASQGIERSPLGLAGTAYDVGRAALGSGPYAAALPPGQQLLPGVSRFNWAGTDAVGPLAQRLRNNLLGVGTAAWAFWQASQGNITGNGPDDPKLRSELMAQGWAPDSIRIGGRYFPLHVLGPLGWPLGEGANLYEATRGGEEGGYAKPNTGLGEQFGDFAQRLGSYFENETFLRGIGQITQALSSSRDATRTAEQEISSIASSLIPQGAVLANAATAMDPFQRRVQPGDIGQALEQRIPGLRQTLPERLSPTAQPEPNPQQGLGILLPRSSVIAGDPILQMLETVRLSPPSAPKTVRVGQQEIALSSNEQQQYEQLRGVLLQQMMTPLTQNQQFTQAPPNTRKQVLQRVMTQADQVAQRQLIGAIAQTGGLASRLAPGPRLQEVVPLRPPIPLTELTPVGATAAAAPTRTPLPITADEFADLDPLQAQEMRRRRAQGLP